MNQVTKPLLVFAVLAICLGAALYRRGHVLRSRAHSEHVEWQRKSEAALARSVAAETELRKLRRGGNATPAPAQAGEPSAPRARSEAAVAGTKNPPGAAEYARMQAAAAEARRQVRVMRVVDAERYLHPQFDKLGLTAEQWSKYENCLLDLLDSEAVAESSGMTEPERKAALSRARQEYEDKTRTLLGDATYSALMDYEKRRARAEEPAPAFVRELRIALELSPTPLQDAQAAALLSIIENGTGTRGARPVLSQEQLAQAGRVLAAPQMTTLLRRQQIAEAMEQLQALSRKQSAILEAAKPVQAPKAGVPERPDT